MSKRLYAKVAGLQLTTARKTTVPCALCGDPCSNPVDRCHGCGCYLCDKHNFDIPVVHGLPDHRGKRKRT